MSKNIDELVFIEFCEGGISSIFQTLQL